MRSVIWKVRIELLIQESAFEKVTILATFFSCFILETTVILLFQVSPLPGSGGEDQRQHQSTVSFLFSSILLVCVRDIKTAEPTVPGPIFCGCQNKNQDDYFYHLVNPPCENRKICEMTNCPNGLKKN